MFKELLCYCDQSSVIDIFIFDLVNYSLYLKFFIVVTLGSQIIISKSQKQKITSLKYELDS